jgi:hypothetical protein
MVFSFSATPDFDFLAQFAAQIQAPVKDGLLVVPQHLGQGSISKLRFGPDFKIVLHRYVLNEELTIRRHPFGNGNDLITMFFYSNEHPVEIAYNNDPRVRFSQRDESAIQITSNDLSSSISFPAHHHINYIVVGITTSKLKSLLSLDQLNVILETITTSGNSFLFFESMNAEMKLVLKNIGRINIGSPLSSFYMQVKVLELLHLLFHKLSFRDRVAHQTINSADAERLLFGRNEIISNLSAPPVIRC